MTNDGTRRRLSVTAQACILLMVILFVASCTHIARDISVFDEGDNKPGGSGLNFGRLEEDIDALEAKGLRRFILEPLMTRGDFFSERGVLGGSVAAQSGERLEMRWEGFFPRYRLYYFPSDKHPGLAIGECSFVDGCNIGFFLAPDNDGNGIPDSFRLIQWSSYDYGYDDGIPDYLDRYRFIYDVRKDKHYLWHDLLLYRCPPPVSSRPDTCKTICNPPYETRSVNGRIYPRILKSRLVESRSLLAEDRD